jgi:hypothetical protein
VVDASGGFVGADFVLTGEDVRDAGTELNDEVPMNTASFGQVLSDTGVPTDGLVTNHPNHRAASTGGILARTCPRPPARTCGRPGNGQVAPRAILLGPPAASNIRRH